MRLLRSTLMLLYRIWFYVLVVLAILLLFPALLIGISRESWYPFFYRVARLWSRIILYGMGFRPVVKKGYKLKYENSYMLVANHTSMTDIMMMLHLSKTPFVFVGKRELARLPVFGYFYRRTCILVDRGNARSRHQVFVESRKRLEKGLSICIFPEGGVPDDFEIVLDEFKDGAFRLAIEHKIPVVPVVLYDNKQRFPFRFNKGGPGIMRALVHSSIPTDQMKVEQKRTLKDEVRKIILDELLK